jgi:hypothetical protein
VRQLDLRYLYQWETILEKPDAKEARSFLEEELKLIKAGFKTRVVPGESGFCLQVPLKDAEVAEDFLKGRVREVIDKPREIYHVFDKDLNYTNKNLDSECEREGMKFVGIGRFWFLAIILLFLLVLLRFVEF